MQVWCWFISPVIPLFFLKLIVMSLMEQAFIMAVTCIKFIFKSYSAEWTVDVRFLNLSEPCHLGERKLGASSLHILPSSSRGGAKKEKITTLGLWNRIYPLYNCWSTYFSNSQELKMSCCLKLCSHSRIDGLPLSKIFEFLNLILPP